MTSREPSSRARRPGRPREAATEHAITRAARDLLAEQGLGGLTMEQVAARAGVAKTTVYRRWPSKVELAVHAVAVTFDTIDTGDRGSLAADMRAGIEEAARLLRDPSTGGAYAALLAESARDPEGVGAAVRAQLSTRLHALVATSVERAVARGEIRPEMADVDLLADVVVGAVLHRSLATGVPDEAFVDGLIELLADVAYARLLLAKRQATNPLRPPAS
ncbi:TetR/AcrR family transcriptional regulator [Knoellia sp. p5-6-4]|uniref:TetR/AcrR family transcriptional regulator n=1 Tax=unclassified Knoellia TaxID=2618719 RepID=UPI0023DC0C39|nr:TetR/AcrR family transcriptional regulator [Knoellia sp. p5-6-4]MDF2146333.1 TetR/AcrR family transcriptional regulator [Knoellia sp. p5-6-4]